MTLELRAREDCAYDAVSLGEVMLRLDPGEGRIRTAREFRVWEGGGEYNVARGLARCFGLQDGGRHLARRQRGRPPGRGAGARRRRRHELDHLGRGRRHRTRRPQRAQLHRAWLRGAWRQGGLGPWSERGEPAAARGHRLGAPVRHAGGAVVPHRRHLRRPVGRDRGRRGRRDGGSTPARHRGVLRPQLPAEPVGLGRGACPGPRGERPDRRARRRPHRQRGGLHRRARVRRRGRVRRT